MLQRIKLYIKLYMLKHITHVSCPRRGLHTNMCTLTHTHTHKLLVCEEFFFYFGIAATIQHVRLLYVCKDFIFFVGGEKSQSPPQWERNKKNPPKHYREHLACRTKMLTNKQMYFVCVIFSARNIQTLEWNVYITLKVPGVLYSGLLLGVRSSMGV